MDQQPWRRDCIKQENWGHLIHFLLGTPLHLRSVNWATWQGAKSVVLSNYLPLPRLTPSRVKEKIAIFLLIVWRGKNNWIKSFPKLCLPRCIRSAPFVSLVRTEAVQLRLAYFSASSQTDGWHFKCSHLEKLFKMLQITANYQVTLGAMIGPS